MMRRRCIAGEVNKCKCPEVGTRLVCSRISRRYLAGMERRERKHQSQRSFHCEVAPEDNC